MNSEDCWHTCHPWLLSRRYWLTATPPLCTWRSTHVEKTAERKGLKGDGKNMAALAFHCSTWHGWVAASKLKLPCQPILGPREIRHVRLSLEVKSGKIGLDFPLHRLHTAWTLRSEMLLIFTEPVEKQQLTEDHLSRPQLRDQLLSLVSQLPMHLSCRAHKTFVWTPTSQKGS